MLIEQTTTSTKVSNPLQTITAACRWTIRRIKDRRAEAHYQSVVSKLPAHLRHDIGAIDYHPAVSLPAAETVTSQKETLEMMWPPYR